MKGRYWVIFEKTETGFSAFVPDLPGCVATGSNKPEVSEAIQDAISFHLEGLELEKLPIPTPNAEAEEVLVEW